jgi:hypothetical protein
VAAKDVFRLLALSTKFEVVACAYPAKVDTPTFYVNYEPGEYEANKYGLLSVKGVGLGFTIVDRKVIQELSDRAPNCSMNSRSANWRRCSASTFTRASGAARTWRSSPT